MCLTYSPTNRELIVEPLTAFRIAAHALNTMAQQLGLGNMAHFWDGERVDEWVFLWPEVKALRNGKAVGYIEVTDSSTSGNPKVDIHILIPDIYQLVRTEHIGEFDPYEYGLFVNYATDWMGTKQPDLEVEWSIGIDEVPTGPANPLPSRRSFAHRAQVIGGING